MAQNQFRTDRYVSLREILRRPLKGTTDLINLVREIGYAILNVAEDQQNVLAALARIERNLIEYIEDSLHFRKKRLEREENHDERDLIDTQDLINKLNERKLMVTAAPAPVKLTETTVQLKPANDAKPGWLTDKIVNLIFMIVGGLLSTIITAILRLAFGGK